MSYDQAETRISLAYLDNIGVLRPFARCQSLQCLWPTSQWLRAEQRSDDGSNSLTNHLILILQSGENSALDIGDCLLFIRARIFIREVSSYDRVFEQETGYRSVGVELVLLVNEDMGEIGEEVGDITKFVQSLVVSFGSTVNVEAAQPNSEVL